MPYNFNISQTEKILIIKSLLGRQSLQHLEILMQAEQEAYNEKGLFEILNNEFRS